MRLTMLLRRHTPSFVIALALLISPFGSLNQRLANAASREPVRAPRGIVASTNVIASQVGVDIMKQGGNAVDAAIAVAFALAVTHPAAGNLGGGGFMMIRLKNGKTTAIDYREMAPAAATRNIYLDKDGNLIEGEGGSLVGYRAAGVPGTVRGMALALQKYGSGKFQWPQLVMPADATGSRWFRSEPCPGAFPARQQRLSFPVSGNKAHLFEQRKVLQRRRSLPPT